MGIHELWDALSATGCVSLSIRFVAPVLGSNWNGDDTLGSLTHQLRMALPV